MELRSQTKQNEKEEYDELKLTLSGIGLFEDQMELKEMQDIMQALHMSEMSCAMEKENNSELFVHSNENVLNSTMIYSNAKRQLNSPESSPEPHFETCVVEALVHHSMDWSPTHGDSLFNKQSECRGSLRKRNSDQDINEKSLEAAKRLRYDSIEKADSGINLSHSTSSSSSHSPQKIDALKIDDQVNIDARAAVEADKTGDGLLEVNSEKLCSNENKEVNIIFNDM